MTLRLAKVCDLIFLIHAFESKPEDFELAKVEHDLSETVANYRRLGYNVHIDSPLDEFQGDFFDTTYENRKRKLAKRLFDVAREYEPTHILIGADSSDVKFALSCPKDERRDCQEELSLTKQMVLVGSKGVSGAHTLILANC